MVKEEEENAIFEMVDATDCDGMYFTVGLFSTLKEAVTALNNCGNDDLDDIGSDGGGFEENARIEIYQRKMGWCGRGKRVFVREYEAVYSNDDEYTWKIIEERSN
jgi:hypothetical protein